MISAARIANWAITATFIPMMTPEPASSANAMSSAALRASSRYPEPLPEYFSQVLLKPSMLSPELADSTLPAAVTPSDCNCSTAFANSRHWLAESFILSSSPVGQS